MAGSRHLDEANRRLDDGPALPTKLEYRRTNGGHRPSGTPSGRDQTTARHADADLRSYGTQIRVGRGTTAIERPSSPALRLFPRLPAGPLTGDPATGPGLPAVSASSPARQRSPRGPRRGHARRFRAKAYCRARSTVPPGAPRPAALIPRGQRRRRPDSDVAGPRHQWPMPRVVRARGWCPDPRVAQAMGGLRPGPLAGRQPDSSSRPATPRAQTAPGVGDGG